uniref:AlNc14C211G8922 protein n=1 Tax=Albugo laibachii Nc14 TaxID=890382 RepID=F0WRB5_9STRA|nr:AlNc14C211G8922 [Albugo laibachii Nc14]|eukprot:CCA23877.1 AlNc14C211G8922 [Albugo laibachii Nc14]
MPSLTLSDTVNSEPTSGKDGARDCTAEAVQSCEWSTKQEKRYSFTPSSAPLDSTIKPRSASVLLSPRIRHFQLHEYDSVHFSKKKLSVASSDGTFSAESAGDSPKSSALGPSSAVNGPFLTGPLAKEFRHSEPFDILSPRSKERDEIGKIDMHATGLLFPPAPAFSSSNELDFYQLSYLSNHQMHSSTPANSNRMHYSTRDSGPQVERDNGLSAQDSHHASTLSNSRMLKPPVQQELLTREPDEKGVLQRNLMASSNTSLQDAALNQPSTQDKARTLDDNKPFENDNGERADALSIVARDVAFHDTFDRVTGGMLNAMKSLLPHTDEKMTHAQVELSCIVRKVQTQLEILNSASQRIRADFEQNTCRLMHTSEEKRLLEAKVEYLELMITQVENERNSLQQQLSQSQGKEAQFLRNTFVKVEHRITDSKLQSLELLNSMQKDINSLHGAIGAITLLENNIEEIRKAQVEALINLTDATFRASTRHSNANFTKNSEHPAGTKWRFYFTLLVAGIIFWGITLSSIYVLFQYTILPHIHQHEKVSNLAVINPQQHRMIEVPISNIKSSYPTAHVYKGENFEDGTGRSNSITTSSSNMETDIPSTTRRIGFEQVNAPDQATKDDHVIVSQASNYEPTAQVTHQWLETFYALFGRFVTPIFSTSKFESLDSVPGSNWLQVPSEEFFSVLGRLAHALKASINGLYSSYQNHDHIKYETPGDEMSGHFVNNVADISEVKIDNTSNASPPSPHTKLSKTSSAQCSVNGIAAEGADEFAHCVNTHIDSGIIDDELLPENTNKCKLVDRSEESCIDRNPVCSWYDLFTVDAASGNNPSVKEQGLIENIGVTRIKSRTSWDNESICHVGDELHTLAKVPTDQDTVEESKSLINDDNAFPAIKLQNPEGPWHRYSSNEEPSVEDSYRESSTSMSAESDEDEGTRKDEVSAIAQEFSTGKQTKMADVEEKSLDRDEPSMINLPIAASERSHCSVQSPFPTDQNQVCPASIEALVPETESSDALASSKRIGAMGNLAASLVSMVQDSD